MNLRYPVNYIAITQYYKQGVHNAVDLGWSYANGGENQPICAPADGVVVAVRSDYNQTDTTGSSYGNYVKINHANGYSTLCAHLLYDSIKVKVGDAVSIGQEIGKMGRTGRADGNHCHYEVFINGEKVNPELYTYVYPGQVVSPNPDATRGLLYLTEPDPEPTPCEDCEPFKKQIKELQDKIELQTKEIEILKEELREKEDIVFEYNVKKTSLYEIKLYEGEKLLISGDIETN